MPTITRIATIQRSLRELGRIRTGDQVEYTTQNGRKAMRPRKLATFRLTSASREYIEAAAEAYQGDVTEWQSPRGREYQVTIVSPTLDVLVPPGDSVTQAFELWAEGGCIRRCDGITQETGEACACPEDPNVRAEMAQKGDACKPTTRLWVILPLLPDLGRWRLESHGYYAAVELAGMAEIASMATAQGVMLPARLRIDQRRRKIPGKAAREYTVPVLELPQTTFGQLVAAGFIATAAPAAIGAGSAEQAALPAGRAAPRLNPGKPAKVERPPLGPAPVLPERAEPFGPATPLEPETFGGWQVDGAPAAAPPTDAPQQAAGPEVAPAPAPPAQPAAPLDLTAQALASLAHRAGRTKGQMAEAIGKLGHPVPAPVDVTAVVSAMSDQVRGLLADELHLEWRTE